jgi:hypothetical protein
MNRIDFTKTGGILRSQELWAYMQSTYSSLFSAIASAVGDNVILSGVDDLGANYGNGWVVISGEILPFQGGLKATQIIIEETITQEQYNDGNSKDAYYTRVAKCANTGGIPVTSFKRMVNISTLISPADLTAALNSFRDSLDDSTIPYDNAGFAYSNGASAGSNIGAKVTLRGTVKIQGFINGPSGGFANNSIYLTLPAQFRPSKNIIKVVGVKKAGGTGFQANAYIGTDGTIRFESDTTLSVSFPTEIHFDGLEYDL